MERRILFVSAVLYTEKDQLKTLPDFLHTSNGQAAIGGLMPKFSTLNANHSNLL